MLVVINNSPWFVGKDVAMALGYERATKAIQDHVDSEDKDEVPIQDSIGRMQKTPIISESGLYALIFGSKLESAKKKSIRYVPSTNKIRRISERANLPSKKVYTVGLQPVLWVKFSLLLIAYKSYTQCTKSRIRGI